MSGKIRVSPKNKSLRPRSKVSAVQTGRLGKLRKQTKTVRRGKASADRSWDISSAPPTQMWGGGGLLGQQSAFTDKQAQRGQMWGGVHMSDGKRWGQTVDLRIQEEAASRDGGDERSQGDPTKGGREDEWPRLNSKDGIVFGGMVGGGQMGIRWGLMVTARRQIFFNQKRLLVLQTSCLSVNLAFGWWNVGAASLPINKQRLQQLQ